MKNTTLKIEEYLPRISGEVERKLEIFRKYLLEYNQKYNLTAITEEKEVFYKHFLDSIMGESAFPLNSSVMEVGSGAGFPSIPLKIFRDDLTFTLLESTGKKCDFLKVIVDNLPLNGVSVLNARAEDAGKSDIHRERYDICTARAVARLNTLAEYCMPFVKVGGLFIAYKGAGAEEEVKEASRAISLFGGEKPELLHYSLPDGMGERTVVVVRKTKQTPEKYPRGNGKERSKPIV